jgi:hypothetical protein
MTVGGAVRFDTHASPILLRRDFFWLLVARNTLCKFVSNFWWPRMRKQIFGYVRKCELYQSAKPAQNVRVGLHSADSCVEPMETFFVDLVGPLFRS